MLYRNTRRQTFKRLLFKFKPLIESMSFALLVIISTEVRCEDLTCLSVLSQIENHISIEVRNAPRVGQFEGPRVALHIGNLVTIKSTKFPSRDLYFVGRMNGRAFFLGSNGDRYSTLVDHVPAQYSLQKIMKIPKQNSINCYAQAVLNSVAFMTSTGVDMTRYPGWNTISKRIDAVEIIDTIIGANTNIDGVNQDRNATKLFNDLGFNSSRVLTRLGLLKHLSKGLPALLRIPVKSSRNQTVDLITGQITTEERIAPTRFTSNDYVGGHAVVWIGPRLNRHG